MLQIISVPLVPDRPDAPDQPTPISDSPDSLMLWYEKFIGKQKHDEAKAMIAEHCGERNFTVELNELADSFTMIGTCQ